MTLFPDAPAVRCFLSYARQDDVVGATARVSVISFAGLQSDEQRQGFVSQL